MAAETALPALAGDELLAQLRAAEKPAVVVRQTREQLHRQCNEAFEQGADVQQLMQQLAADTDQILTAIWQLFALHKSNHSLAAVGGYGRGELHPHSDIDLLILIDNNAPTTELESFLTFLWDLQLQLGHSVRTVDECVKVATDDLTVITSLMELRLLTGDTNKITTLQQRIRPDHIWNPQRFYSGKWEEQILRHHKFGDTEYNLEPNLKDGPGGLRDIQIITWLARRTLGSGSIGDMQAAGLITADEASILQAGRNYLNRVRWSLHILAGRGEDRLLFDHQRQLAIHYGYSDKPGSLAVEQFMQVYYRHSIELANMNELLMQVFEEQIWDTFAQAVPQAVNPRFQLRDRHLEPVDNGIFLRQPSAILETFVILAENSQIIGTTVSCLRGIRAARHLIDENYRQNPANTALFVRLINANHKLATQLRRMNQQGILSRYLPEWAGIVGKMQHDLFHIYTVDAHTIQIIKYLRLLTYEGGIDRYPLATEVVQQLPKLDLLYIAGLYHDIAKGRGGDHSELGAIDVSRFCQRHGYNEPDTALAAWLVKNHLLMSSTSQRKDISDPDVIREFALTVGSVDYLNYLFVLTVADINATNTTLWTTWRASLLRQLYHETRRALRRGLDLESNRAERISSTRRLALLLLSQQNYTRSEVEQAWNEPGDEYFLRETAADIAWHTEAVINHNSGPLVLLKDTDNRRFEGATQVFIYTADTHQLFARTAVLFSQLNLNIQDARIYSNARGYSLNTYVVLGADNQPLSSDSRQQQHIRQALINGLTASNKLSSFQPRVPRALKHFSYSARANYVNDDGKNHTIIEVTAPDRAGLLATVAQIFNQHQLTLKNAKISTFGERVEDVFFVTTQNDTKISDQQLLATVCQNIVTALNEQNSE